MKELSISELLQLQSTLRKETSLTQNALSEGAYTETNGDIVTESIDVETLQAHDEKLDELHALSIQVADKLHEANRGTKISHINSVGETIELNLASALDYVKQIRSKAAIYERLGRAKKMQVNTGYGTNERIVTERTYDIESYAKNAQELVKEANRLSREIERQSVLVLVQVDGVEAYL